MIVPKHRSRTVVVEIVRASATSSVEEVVSADSFVSSCSRRLNSFMYYRRNNYRSVVGRFGNCFGIGK